LNFCRSFIIAFGFVEILGSVRRFSEKEERLWVKSCYGFGECSHGRRRGKMWWKVKVQVLRKQGWNVVEDD
jgi:hypothetical protein